MNMSSVKTEDKPAVSAVQKITGTLTLGPARHDRTAAIYKYIRVGSTHLERVKIPGVLDTLLRDGAPCTLWVVTIKTPTPFLYRTEIRLVYAVEIAGTVYKAIDEVKRGWTSAKWLGVLVLLGVGAITILLYVGLLFWINAVRLSFVELPLDEMRREPG